MSTEKRLFLFLVLSLLILLSFQHLYKHDTPAPATQKVEEATEEFAPQEVINESSAGGPAMPQVADASLTTYETEDYILTISRKGGFIHSIEIKKYAEVLPYQDLLAVPGYLDKDFTIQRLPQGLRLLWQEGEAKVVKEIRFPSPYLWEIQISTPSPLDSVNIFSRTKEEDRFYGRYQELFYKTDLITRLSWTKLKETLVLPGVSLAGARDSYYTACLFDFPEARTVLRKSDGIFTLAWKPLAPVSSFQCSLYIGPQDQELLQLYGIQEVRNFGFFHPIAMIILKVLHFFFSIFKNWGACIILFSILVYVLFFPLTFKSSKAMKEMREFQAMHKQELDKLKEKYKDQPQKIQQATMELYKKYGFNPLKGCSSGCLPLVFQIPIIWAFWSVIPRALEFKGASFLWIHDLSLPDHAFHLPATLPFLGDWLNILPLLTSVVMYVQMKFSNPEIDPSQAQQQQIMATVFPIMMAVFFYKLPSALLLYWFTNSVLTAISQWRIMKMKKA